MAFVNSILESSQLQVWQAVGRAGRGWGRGYKSSPSPGLYPVPFLAVLA